MSTHANKKRGIKPPVPPKGGRQTKIKEPSTSTSTTDSEPMASFLPFCAHCEKQIAVPNNTILYCSEKCRKQDNQKMPPLNASTSCPTLYNWETTPPPLAPSHTGGGAGAGGYFDIPVNSYPSSPTSPRMFPEHFGSNSLSAISPGSGFQQALSSPTESLPSSPPATFSNIYMPQRRPTNHIRTLTSNGAAPPTTGHTAFYNAYQRPLPPLHPRTYSSSPRSIELVTPISATAGPTSDPSSTTNGPSTTPEALGEKIYVIPESAFRQSATLKTMFNFDKIQGKVTAATSTGFARVAAVGTEIVDGVKNGVVAGSKGDYGRRLPSTTTHFVNGVRMPNAMRMIRN